MIRHIRFFVLLLLAMSCLVYSQNYNTSWLSSIYVGSKAFDVKVEGRFAYVVGWDYLSYGSFTIIDVQFPTAPNLVSTLWINEAFGVDVSSGYAYLAESTSGLSIYDISNPALPQFVSQLYLPGNAKDVKVVDDIAYVADEYAGLRIINVSNPQNPIEIGYFDSPGRSFDVEIKDSLAFLADLEGGLICLNISNPANPSMVSTFPASETIVDVELVGSLAYFTDGYTGIKVVNITDPTNISLVDVLPIPYWCLGIRVVGDYAYVAAWEFGGLRIMDISNPEELQEVGYYNTFGKSRDVDVVGGIAYVADWDGGGLTIINNNLINPVPVELISFAGEYYDGVVNLSWATATELNNSGFEVERKSEPDDWEKVTFIQGNGTTTETKYYSYSDIMNEYSSTKLIYRLKQIDFDGSTQYSSEIEIDIAIPNKFNLEQNFPNPFNPSTTIKFALPQKSNVTITVYNSIGEEVQVLLNNFMDAGYHQVNFNTSGLASGIYFYTLKAGNFIQTKKMILLK